MSNQKIVKISQLVEALNAFKSDYGDIGVLTSGYESGYDTFSVEHVKVKFSPDKVEHLWEGQYVDQSEGQDIILLKRK